jgi:ABC-type sugar transport system substrate-binding protein
MTKAEDFLKPWDTLPTKLPAAYTALAKTPTPGGTIIRLVGPIPTDNDSQAAQVEAAKTIGWTAKKISYNGSVEDLNAKFEQAISEKPTVIAISGQPATGVAQPLAHAKAAGIVVSLDNIVDPPTANPGYAVLTSGDKTAKLIGELNAYMFMRDSKCAGSAAIFDLPFPILKVSTDAFRATVKQNCSACKVSYHSLQVSQIATPAGTSAIVSALQSSPSTKYVYSVISDLSTGVATALQQAGLSGVRIFGSVPDAQAILALRNKTAAWWVDQSAIIDGWTQLDGALRAIESGKVLPDTGEYPLAVLTQDNVSSSDDPTYPADYQEEFKQLWTGAS